MKILLLNPINPNIKAAMNKDLAGGMGTLSNFGNSIFSRIISFVKKRGINIPILSYAYLQSIFLQQGHEVEYIENIKNFPRKNYDLILIYGSIVDYKYENKICREIKKKCKNAKIGFFGSFPSIKPSLFLGDFIIQGEAESYFLYEFKTLKNLGGLIKVKKPVDMNDLLTPNFNSFPIQKYSYFPAIKEKPLLTLQASRGCPYSCSYYCPYGTFQGAKYRTRNVYKVIEDIQQLIKKYKIKGLQFRDPTFGIDKRQLFQFIELMKENNIKIKFGIETRLDILDKKILKNLFEIGLRNINIGIETIDNNIARLNKRKLTEIKHQEEIINYCNKLGIKISAFYILGYPNDTEENIKKTIKYAIKLNTNVAQFCISCPYPGTEFYKELDSNGLLLEKDFEKFNSVNLVFKHPNLTQKRILELQQYAFKKYYFRINYLINFLKWQIKEFWL
ncbi:radical SAM protein [Candidatus Pacearchaeota archaeon]|nr:radical SAM protein [Candidatus Pacearchaeota archaeon]